MLKIENMDIEKLVPYANNSRTHDTDQVDQIIASITEFGFTNPVLIDEGGGVIAGHGRIMAAKKMGMADIPCIVLAGLSETQKRAYIIADNKLALNAGWEEDLLQLELVTLDDVGFDYSELGLEFDFDEYEDEDDFIPNLPTGDREPIRNMTFTVSDEQHELIEEAIKAAKGFDPEDPAGINENSNGNALYYICEVFKNGLDS